MKKFSVVALVILLLLVFSPPNGPQDAAAQAAGGARIIGVTDNFVVVQGPNGALRQCMYPNMRGGPWMCSALPPIPQ